MKFRLYLIIMDQYYFTNYNKCAILMKDVNNRENWMWDKGKLSVQYSQFFCKSKTVLK